LNLFDEEIIVDEELASGPPEFIDKGDGTYSIVVRFRNQEDYYEFLDKIGKSKLKVYNPTRVRETSWPEEVLENNLFG
jgi:hypothetical protein